MKNPNEREGAMSRSKIHLDIQTIHEDDIGSIVGVFCGTPIREWYPASSQLREYQYMVSRMAIARETNNALSV